MLQQNQFIGHPTEDPNEHLDRFLRMANTVKLNGVRLEVIKLHLFPFSLRNIVATWYESLPYSSVDMSRPDPGPTRLADPNRSPGRDTIYIIYILYTGTLIDLFFLRAVLVPVVYKQFL